MNLDVYINYVILPILAISHIIVFIRLYKGPEVVDRVVALDLLISMGVGTIAVYSISTNQNTFLDVGLILALIAFLATIAFSYYLEKKGKE
jgi:multicomponent Na+:H+ antiporter subunit F